MRGFALAVSIGFLMTGVSTLAQAPAQPAPKPAGQAPAAPAPAPAKPAPTTPAPAAAQPGPPPTPPAPFPQGAKVAFVNLQAIAQLSADGKAANAKVQALAQKKQAEGQAKAKQLQDNQQKLQTSGAVMSEQARSQLEKEIERQQVEGQRLQQDAQTEVQELQQELQADFQRKLLPVIQQVAQEKGIQLLLSQADAGIVWADPGLDLTNEIVKKLDALRTPPTKQ